MSAQPVSKEDIIKGNPFADIAKEIELAVTQLTEFDVELKKVSVELSNVAKNSKSTIDGINAINLAEKQSKKVVDEKLANDKLLAKIKKEQQSAEQSLQRQREKGMAQMAKEAQRAAEAERPYNKMSATLNKLRKEYKDLAVAGAENSTEARKMKREIDSLDKTLKRVDGNVGQFQRNVGNYSSAFGKMRNALGSLGLTFGAGALLRESFNIVKDFDQGVANLASVLGTTRSQIQGLEQDAKRLGATTSFTAGEVANLQTEFAKLGFTEQEILKVTEGTLNLAAATGTELARAAEVAGSTLRGFGLDASETNRVTDVMAKSFSASALDMEKFAESMKYVAPIAKVAGLSIEETTAMLGAMANAGISGSMAGTSLRQIISQLDKTGKTTAEALKDLAKEGLNLAGAEDEVGKNAKTALLVLADQTTQIDKLSSSFNDAEGSSKKMADEQLNTLGGAVKLLTSAFEGYILGVNDASQAGSGFKDFIKYTAENLPSIISTLGKLLGLYLIMIARQKVLNSGLLDWSKNLLKANQGMTQATGNAQKFGNALKGIGWTVAIGLAIDLGMKLWDIASGAEQARDAMARFDKQIKKSSDQAVKNIASIQEAEKLQVAKLNELLKDRKISAEDYLKLIEKAKNASKEELSNNIKSANERKKRYKELRDELLSLQKQSENSGGKFVELQKRAGEIAKELNITGDKAYGFLETDADDLDVIAQLNANIAGTNERIKAYSGALKEANEEKSDFKAKTKEEIEASNNGTNATNNNTNATNNNTKAKKDNTKELEAQKRALQDLADIENEQAEKRKTKDDERLARQIELGELIEEAKKTDREFEMTEQEKEIQAVEDKYRRMADLTEEFVYGEVELNEAMREEINLINTKYAQDEIAIQEEKNKELENEETKKLERQKEIAEEMNKIQEGISEALKEQIDKRIELSKKEEESAKSRQDFFENLAENGNITAQQSISEQIEIQREAQEEQARLERKKQQIEMISAGLSTFNASIANGKTPASALAETVSSTTTLVEILKNLNFFAKGTDNAPAGLAVVDEKGAELITDEHGNIKDIGTNKGARFTMLDQGDKVFTATKTASFLNSMKVAEPKTDNAGNTMDLIKINETLKRIEAQNKGNSMSVDWGGISGGVANIVERKIVGRSRTTNVFRS